MVLDEVDEYIIEALGNDSRLTSTQLSRMLEIPRTTIKFRIDRLLQDGIIKKFTLTKDYRKLGLPTTAFILISFDSSRGVTQNDVAKSIHEIKNVDEVHIISGEYDLLVKIRGSSIEDVGDSVVDRLHSVPGVARTLTLTSFREIEGR